MGPLSSMEGTVQGSILDGTRWSGSSLAAVAILAASAPTCAFAQAASPATIIANVDARSVPLSSPIRAALTVEGGGTLGTYEGGLTWALVEMFRRHRILHLPRRDSSWRDQPATDSIVESLLPIEFRAAAGASAGSINAFLAANRWCATDTLSSAQDSPFWTAWIPTALADMMPEENATPGVFSRGSYKKIFDKLDASWRRSRYDADCKVTFGAAITRLSEDSLPISEARKVFARNQRYAAAFVVEAPRVRNSVPRYVQSRRDRASPMRLGAVVELPLDSASDSLARQVSHDLITASSGFPLVFEPYRVAYCRPRTRQDSARPRGLNCPEKTVRDSSYFVDGGVFDNGPLTIAYGIALTDTSRFSIDSLTMVFVTPNRRRGKKDRAGDSTDRKTEGLDAVMKLLSTFVPSARQYELQIAARFLPTIQDADNTRDISDARITRLEAEKDIRDTLAIRQYGALTQVWHRAQADVAWLSLANDSLRQLLAQCRLQQCSDSASVASDGARASLDKRWLSQPPARLALDSLVAGVLRRREPFDSLLFVTSRWHNLAGDWLFGFGGFIGRPFREYDFYVGVYDGLAMVAQRIRCRGNTDTTCARSALATLILRPPLMLDESEQRLLVALYKKEYGEVPHSLATLEKALDSVTQRERLLRTIIDVMSPQSTPRCKRGGGPIERLSCGQGMTATFKSLGASPGVRELIQSPDAYCDRTPGRAADCVVDARFVRFIERPTVELNYLAGDVLDRLWNTTPNSSGFKSPLTMANAIYYSTNERSRSRMDGGSVSVPSRRGGKASLLWVLPSSVGGFAGVQGWYAEWTARWHTNQNIAMGPAFRLVWASRVRTPAPEDYATHFVPSLRVELKAGGSYAPWISTAGIDVAYWGERGHWNGKRRLSPGFTSALFAQKIRIQWALRPRPTRRPQTVFTIGIGDVPGLVYWIGQFFGQRFH